MITSIPDERVKGVRVTDDSLVVTLFDGRTLTTPLSWYPKLLQATEAQRKDWRTTGAGYGIHWPQIDEDLSVEGMLRGVTTPGASWQQEQIIDAAKNFYSEGLALTKTQLESNRIELEKSLEQLPENQGEAASQIQELVDSYASIINTLDRTAETLDVDIIVKNASENITEAVKRNAEVLGVDLYQIKGTGDSGQIGFHYDIVGRVASRRKQQISNTKSPNQ